MRVRGLLLAVLLVACTPGSHERPKGVSMTDATTEDSRGRAEQLIGKVARQQGREFAGLPAANEITFGPTAFRYEPRTATVTASVLVVALDPWVTFPEYRPAIERTLAGLSDPRLGGMFDTGGGEWMFDRTTGRLSLGVRRPVDVDPTEFKRAFERVQAVQPDWRMSWFAAVADMVHDGAAPPRNRVTVDENPYRPD